MGRTSKDLLHLEHKNPSSASLESTLLVCKKDSQSQTKRLQPDGKPITSSVPKSQVLGKVRDFLGVLSEANKTLQLDAKDNSQNYDIEALTGNESEVIEMDLMLGVADLHTPEAVAAAESAIAGYQPMIPLAAISTGTESDDCSDDDTDEDEDYNNDDNDYDKTSPPALKRCKSRNDDSSSKAGGNNHQSKKRPKIVELM